MRRAEKQIQALFDRRTVRHLPAARARPPRLVLCRDASGRQEPRRACTSGMAAQGRSLKVVMLRAYLALLGGGAEGLRRRRRQEATRQPGRPLHDAARLLQQPARAGRQPPDRRGRGRAHGSPATRNRKRDRREGRALRRPEDRLRGGRADLPRQHRQGRRGEAAARRCRSTRRTGSTWRSPRT